MLGLTPNIIYPTCAFYDPQNNPLNISCEGPRVCPVTIDLSKDTTFVLDFSQLFISGKMTSIQSVMATCHTVNFSVNLVTDAGYGISINDNSSGIYPIFCGVSPKVTITQSAVSAGGSLILSFLNYYVPTIISSAAL